AIRDDLRQGLSAIPEWMQGIVRELLRRTESEGKQKTSKSKKEVVSRKTRHQGDAAANHGEWREEQELHDAKLRSSR
ncbi:MAG: hypothetical protein ACRD4I_09870, partial [Candidatus Angelobacter sp.]